MALKRRCLHLFIDYPSPEIELAILKTRISGIDEKLASELVRVVHAVRELDLKKKPSVSETIDWARALLVLNASSLDETLVRDTLNVILKYEGTSQNAVKP